MRLLRAMHENERFSTTEQTVIKYILAHPSDMAELSIRELAEHTFTSAAAIFRLCQKLGLKGYNEFKIKFISEMNRVAPGDGTIIERPITGRDAPADIVRKMAALEIEAIEETKNELDLDQLLRIVGWLEQAEVIDIYAYDQNFSLAQMAAYNWMQLGRIVNVHAAMNSQYMQALHADQHHLAIIISRTGENKRLIAVEKILRERGVHTVLFTSSCESTLAQYCDEFLYVANTVEYLDLGGMLFSVGMRYYSDLLFSLLLSRDYKRLEKSYDHFEDIFGRLHDDWRLW
jgi:DNA-binding MurR/RpiR family transcriptional regulator